MYAMNLTMDQIMPRPNTQSPSSQSGKCTDSQEASEFSVLLQQKCQKMRTPPHPQDNAEDQCVPAEQYALAASLTAVAPMLFFVPPQSEAQPVLADAVQMSPDTQLTAVNPAPPETSGLGGAALGATPAWNASLEIPQESNPTPVATAADAPLSPLQTPAAAAQAQTPQQNGGGQLDSGAQKQSEDALPNAAAEVQAPLFPQADAVPIPVGHSNRQPMELPSADAADQLSGRLTQAFSQNTSKLEIHLSPQHLGDLSVEITRADDGSLSVVLKPTTGEALTLLERHSTRLQTLLAANAQGPVRVEVQQEGQQTDLPQFLNPDGGENHSRQQQHRQQQSHPQNASQDFLQQLRLGLAQLQPAAV